MANSKLLVPVVLSLMNSYKAQSAQMLKEIKQVESALYLPPEEKSIITDKERSELIRQVKQLKYDLAEKEEVHQGFSEIYERRKWLYIKLANSNNIAIH